jgi:hypothetical protein
MVSSPLQSVAPPRCLHWCDRQLWQNDYQRAHRCDSLSSQFTGRKNYDSYNLPFDLAKTILCLRPWDKLCVMEIAAAVRGNRIPLKTYQTGEATDWRGD